MAISVNPLLASLDSHLTAAADAEFMSQPAPVPEDELVSPEALSYVAEQALSEDALRAGRFERLRRALVRLGLENATRAARQQLAAYDTQLVPTPSREWSLTEALATLVQTSETSSRDELGRAVWPVAAEARGPLRRVVDDAFAAARARGASSPAALLPDPLAAARLVCADAALARSEDAYLDVMGFALKRVFQAPRPLRSARIGDVLRATALLDIASHFSGADLHGVVTRWLNDLQWAPRGLVVDSARTSRPPLAAPVRPPSLVKLRLAPRDGVAAWSACLLATFEALHHASLDPNLLLVDRRLGDPALPLATGLWASNHLADASWLMRYVALSRGVAREVARLVSLRHLTSVRVTAAMLPASEAMATRGLTAEVVELAQTRLSTALRCDVPVGFAVRQLDLFTTAHRFDALALAGAVAHDLVNRFDIDAFRQPQAGHLLAAHCARGHAVDAADTVKRLQPKLEHGCELDAAITPLLAALGA